MPVSDFRAVRWVLEPKDFALGDDSLDEHTPDLVDEKVWRSVVALPDDVAIRTSNHFGTVIEILHDWSADILHLGISISGASSLSETPLGMVLFTCYDDFRAAIYNALVGYYRVGHSCIRTCFEHLIIGLWFEMNGNAGEFRDWVAGRKDVTFGFAADILSQQPRIAALESTLFSQTSDNLLRRKDKNANDPGGLLRRIYGNLSGLVHGGPGHTEFDMWQSNGPVLSPGALESLSRYAALFVACASICSQVARPQQHLLGNDEVPIVEVFKQALESIGNVHQDWSNVMSGVPDDLWI